MRRYGQGRENAPETAEEGSGEVIQLLIIAIAGVLWAAMWSLSGRIWRVKDDSDVPDSSRAR